MSESTVNENNAAESENATSLINDIQAYHAKLFVDGEEESIRTQINDYFSDLFEDAEDAPSVRTQIGEFEEKASGQSASIQKFHDELLVDTEETKSVKTRIGSVRKSIVIQRDAIKALHDELLIDGEIPAIKTQIDEFHDSIFSEESEEKGLQLKFQEAYSTVKEQADAIDELHDLLLVDDDGENAATCHSTDINNFYNEIFEDADDKMGMKSQLAAWLANAQMHSDDIDKYHTELLVDDTNAPSTKTQINAYYKKTQREFSELRLELTKKIEDLLPSAAAAGLASSYDTARRSYSRKYSQAFYYTLLLAPLLACAYLYVSPPDSLVAIETAVMENRADYTTLMIFRALLAFPLVAISLFGFSSLRLSRRMAEEYNHKQRVMELYTGFKKEIDSLALEMKDKQEGVRLKGSLLKIMLKTVEQHPSQAMKEVDRGWLSELVQILGKRTEPAERSNNSTNSILETSGN